MLLVDNKSAYESLDKVINKNKKKKNGQNIDPTEEGEGRCYDIDLNIGQASEEQEETGDYDVDQNVESMKRFGGD